jgi:hypothetical protein
MSAQQTLEPLADDSLDADRVIIRQSLDDIASEVRIALRDAGLNYSVYLAVPNSGESLATLVTPLYPADDDWSHITAIVQQAIARRIGGIGLSSRELPCAMANSTVSAADVIAG